MIKSSNTSGMDTIRSVFVRLARKDQLKIVEELERLTRKERWKKITQTIRRRIRQNPLPNAELDSLCEDARQKIYVHKTKSRR